jgi:hypothetical protein
VALTSPIRWPFGVAEVGDHRARAGNLVRAHQALPAEALRLGERGLDVGHLDVEGDVPGVALDAADAADAAASADSLRIRVSVALNDAVVHRAGSIIELPSEEVCE